MIAQYDTLNGEPVLRLTVNHRGKRHTLDLPLTPDQDKAVRISMVNV